MQDEEILVLSERFPYSFSFFLQLSAIFSKTGHLINLN